jgi:4-hydroxybenzoate polyprenyltransferase
LTGFWPRAVLYGQMVKLSHSVFALPFALASAAMAARDGVRGSQIAWIVVAMVGARSAAMGFNRLADQSLDAANPRTAGRELPRGALSRAEVWAFVIASAALLITAAWQLNRLCLYLSPVALLLVFGYSYTKRFTSFSHVFLGLALAIAPVGAWLAIRGGFAWPPIVLAAAVLFWVAGFDIIYACQDVEFDRRQGLRSIPARLGVRGALRAARVLHVATIGALLGLPWLTSLHPLYFAGIALVALLLAYEHSLVRHDDLSRVNAAFFTVNGWVGVLYLVTTLVAVRLA